MGILEDIVKKKRERIADARAKIPLEELKSRVKDQDTARPFERAIRRARGTPLRVVAELKKSSPSQGVIRRDFNPEELARRYTESGASALSVLTEEDYFEGSLGYISRVKHVTPLPVLRKDFIVDAYQMYEARAFGADAILLIAALLGKAQAEDYLHLARETGLSVLFEVHQERELETALSLGAIVIGINNRDLKTLQVNLGTTMELLRDIPPDRIVVSESGIERREDVLLLEQARVDAVLVGTSLMKANDIGSKYRELFGNKAGS